jgi:hypothetical protein
VRFQIKEVAFKNVCVNFDRKLHVRNAKYEPDFNWQSPRQVIRSINAEAAMSALIFVLIVADGLILVLSYAQATQGWAVHSCNFLLPLCDYPSLLIIAGSGHGTGHC